MKSFTCSPATGRNGATLKDDLIFFIRYPFRQEPLITKPNINITPTNTIQNGA